jgi:3-dehydroquinate synthase
MVMAAHLSLKLGLVDALFVARLTALIAKAGLPVTGPVLSPDDSAGRYLELMRVDKKSEAGDIKFVLIDGPGRAVVRSAPEADVRQVIDFCCHPKVSKL